MLLVNRIDCIRGAPLHQPVLQLCTRVLIRIEGPGPAPETNKQTRGKLYSSNETASDFLRETVVFGENFSEIIRLNC